MENILVPIDFLQQAISTQFISNEVLEGKCIYHFDLLSIPCFSKYSSEGLNFFSLHLISERIEASSTSTRIIEE
jgi:hypothetical protein